MYLTVFTACYHQATVGITPTRLPHTSRYIADEIRSYSHLFRCNSGTSWKAFRRRDVAYLCDFIR